MKDVHVIKWLKVWILGINIFFSWLYEFFRWNNICSRFFMSMKVETVASAHAKITPFSPLLTTGVIHRLLLWSYNFLWFHSHFIQWFFSFLLSQPSLSFSSDRMWNESAFMPIFTLLSITSDCVMPVDEYFLFLSDNKNHWRQPRLISADVPADVWDDRLWEVTMISRLISAFHNQKSSVQSMWAFFLFSIL